MSAEIIGAAVAELFAPVVLALAAAAGAWLAARLPGPLRDWLASGTHARDVALIGQAMLNRAIATSTPGGPIPQAVAVKELESYARAVLPEVLEKIKPTGEAMRTIALAALARAAAETAPASRSAGTPPG